MKDTVTLTGDSKTIIINNLTIESHTVYRMLEDMNDDDRVENVRRAVQIGIMGLRRMEVSEDVDYVEKEFQRMSTEFDKMFDPELKSSHLGRLLALLDNYFRRGGTLETLLDPTSESTPLGKLSKQITGELSNLANVIKKKEAVEEVKEVTTLKGYDFEDLCDAILSNLVSKQFGDEMMRTSKETGTVTHSFAGDFVISLRESPDLKMVLECKDEAGLTLPTILDDLETAMENRNAQYGILIAKHIESFPKKIGWFNEYRGNSLVCALGSEERDTFFPEVLNIAYQWGRMRLLEKMWQVKEADLKTIGEHMVAISSKLREFSQILTQCTNIETSTRKIREISASIAEDIEERLTNLQKIIRPSEITDHYED